MTEAVKTEKPQLKARRRSGARGRGKVTRPYPKAPLAKALEIPYKIKELNGGNPWAPAQVAEAVSMSPKTPDFYYLGAASRDFGLTTGTRDTALIALTDFGRELVYAPSPDVEHAKKVEAFHKIDLFSKVLQHYKSSTLPEMKYLGNTLEREFALSPKFHEEFSRVFSRELQILGHYVWRLGD